MFAIMASALSQVGSWFANFGSAACVLWILDEPKCPKSLLK